MQQETPARSTNVSLPSSNCMRRARSSNINTSLCSEQSLTVTASLPLHSGTFRRGNRTETDETYPSTLFWTHQLTEAVLFHKKRSLWPARRNASGVSRRCLEFLHFSKARRLPIPLRCYASDGIRTGFVSGHGFQPCRNTTERNRALQAAEKCRFCEESSPQRLKPNSLHNSYVRPKGRTLHRSEFFRSLFSPWDGEP